MSNFASWLLHLIYKVLNNFRRIPEIAPLHRDLASDCVIYVHDQVLVVDAKFGSRLIDSDSIKPTNLNRTIHHPATPPLSAEFLFHLFLSSQSCDALVGDLEERYKHIHTKFGQRRADFWYWTQAIRSVGPIAWAWTKKAALKPGIAVISWGVAIGLVRQDSWLAAVVELYRRITS